LRFLSGPVDLSINLRKILNYGLWFIKVNCKLRKSLSQCTLNAEFSLISSSISLDAIEMIHLELFWSNI
jgi:hypothetical protein